MRKLSKIFGVALIATSMLVSVTGCSLDAQLEELQTKLAAEEAENAKLKKQLADLNEQLNLLMGVDTENQELKDRVTALIKEISDLNDALEAAVTVEEVESYQSEIAELKAKVAALIAENNELKNATATYEVTFVWNEAWLEAFGFENPFAKKMVTVNATKEEICGEYEGYIVGQFTDNEREFYKVYKMVDDYTSDEVEINGRTYSNTKKYWPLSFEKDTKTSNVWNVIVGKKVTLQ